MAEEITFENERISNFEGTLSWPWIGSYWIPSCITHQPLPTCQISLKSKKLFADGWMYWWTDRHLWPTLLGRFRRVDLKITEWPHTFWIHRLLTEGNVELPICWLWNANTHNTHIISRNHSQTESAVSWEASIENRKHVTSSCYK